MPHSRPGQTIGLLGGSFDPAHEGHALITKAALRRFGFDQVWWMLTPQNPLKSQGPAPLQLRLQRARAVMSHPRVKITAVEQLLGTQYTAETIAALQSHYPAVRFTWLMGADNLAEFHLWQDWTAIMARVPVGVLARPGSRLTGRLSMATRVYRTARIPAGQSHRLPLSDPPAWCFIDIPMSDMSSSRVRDRGNWGAPQQDTGASPAKFHP